MTVDERREYNREYRKNNRERLLEYKRNYYATHPEQREKRDAQTRQWIAMHRREWNIYQSNYQYRRNNGVEEKEN